MRRESGIKKEDEEEKVIVQIEEIPKEEKQLQRKRERFAGLAFCRAISSIGIIFFHYATSSACPTKVLFTTINATWGTIFNTVFLAISGSALYLNYPGKFPVGQFYWKRWKSISCLLFDLHIFLL